MTVWELCIRLHVCDWNQKLVKFLLKRIFWTMLCVHIYFGCIAGGFQNEMCCNIKFIGYFMWLSATNWIFDLINVDIKNRYTEKSWVFWPMSPPSQFIAWPSLPSASSSSKANQNQINFILNTTRFKDISNFSTNLLHLRRTQTKGNTGMKMIKKVLNFVPFIVFYCAFYLLLSNF